MLDRLGLGYERLRRVREDIIVVSMSGRDHTGPCRDYVSYADAVSAPSPDVVRAPSKLNGEY